MTEAILLAGDYVEVEPELRLPRHLRQAEIHVRAFDASLRLRQSIEPERRRAGLGFILERKNRYTLLPQDSADRDVQVATRDGYAVISAVHATRLMRPESLLEGLRAKGDLGTMTAESRYQEIVSDQKTAKTERRDKRFKEMRAFYRESFDVLDRVGDRTSHAERFRINNAGGAERFNITDHRRIRLADVADSLKPRTTSAGEIPAEESSDVHSPGAARRPEGDELHAQPDAG